MHSLVFARMPPSLRISGRNECTERETERYTKWRDTFNPQQSVNRVGSKTGPCRSFCVAKLRHKDVSCLSANLSAYGNSSGAARQSAGHVPACSNEDHNWETKERDKPLPLDLLTLICEDITKASGAAEWVVANRMVKGIVARVFGRLVVRCRLYGLGVHAICGGTAGSSGDRWCHSC